MKIKLNHVFTEASGKLCKKESTYVAYNKKTGKMYTAEYHERDISNSTGAVNARKKFTEKAHTASSWWQTNKAKESDDYKKVMKAYDEQSKYGNPYSFFLSVFKNGVLTLGENTSGTTTPTTRPSEDNSF